jgi:transcriptional regulator with XRE-family HTH domain
MTPSENSGQHAKSYKAIISQWPIERIQALSKAPGLSIQRLAAVLGITRRTLRFLMAGTYTPSATMCRRMEMLESDVRDGKDLYADILPRRSEMRRRLLLFRAWWMAKPPTVDLPLVTVSIKVTWGKGLINTLEIPVHLMPKLRINRFVGLVETVREVTKSLRKVTKNYQALLWDEMQEDFWNAYASNDIPEIVQKRLAIPATIRKVRTLKDANNRRPAS